jgi:hypothetical protein
MVNAVFVEVTKCGAAGFFVTTFGHRAGIRTGEVKPQMYWKGACLGKEQEPK